MADDDLVRLGVELDTSTLGIFKQELEAMPGAAATAEGALNSLGEASDKASARLQESARQASAVNTALQKTSEITLANIPERMSAEQLRAMQASGAVSPIGGDMRLTLQASDQATQANEQIEESFTNAALAAKLFREAVDNVSAAIDRGKITETQAVSAIDSASAAYLRQAQIIEKSQQAVSEFTGQQRAVSVTQIPTKIAIQQQVIAPSLTGMDTTEQEAGVLAMARALDNLQAKYSPVSAAARSFQENISGITQALNVGVISEEEASRAIDEASAAYSRQSLSIEKARASLDNYLGQQRAVAGVTQVPTKVAIQQSIIEPSTTGIDPNTQAANVEAMGRALDELRNRYDPVSAAAHTFQQAVEQAGQAVKVGAVTQEQATRAIDEASVAYSRQVASIESARQAVSAYLGEQARTETVTQVPTKVAIQQSIIAPSITGLDTSQQQANVEAMARALDELQQKYNPLAAAANTFSQTVEQANEALRSGYITQEQATTAIDQATAAYTKQTQSIEQAQQALNDYLGQQQRSSSVTQVPTRTAIQQSIIAPSSTGMDTRQQAADVAAYGKSLDDLRAKFNPLYAAGRQYKSTLDEITQAHKAGALSDEEFGNAIQTTKDAFAKEVNSLKEVGSASEGVAHSHGNVSTYAMAAAHSIRGFTEMTMQGVNPMRSLMMESNNLAYAMSGPGGLVNSMKVGIGQFTQLLPAGMGLVGMFGAAGVAALGLALHWDSSQKAIERSMMTIGGASGATVKSINEIADASSSSTKLTVGEAREAALAIAGIGTVGVKNIRPLTDSVYNLSVLLGTTTAKAAQVAGEAIGGIAEGRFDALEKLNHQIQALSASDILQIQNMTASGNAAEAQKLAIDKIAEATKNAGDTAGFFGSIWRGVSKGVSETIDVASSGMSRITGIGQTLDEKYQDALTTIKMLQSMMAEGGMDVPEGAIESAQKYADTLKKSIDERSARQQQIKENLQSNQAMAIAQQVAPEVRAPQEMTTKQTMLRQQIQRVSQIDTLSPEDMQVLEQLTVAENRLQAARTNRMNATGEAITVEQHENMAFQAGIQTITARTNAERMEAVAATARAQAVNSPIDAGTLQDQAKLTLQTEINQKVKDTSDLQQRELGVAQAITGAQKLAAQEVLRRFQYEQSGLLPAQAAALAANDRKIAETQITASAQANLLALQDQANVAAAVTGAEKMKAQAETDFQALIRQNVDPLVAQQVAAQKYANAQAQVNASVAQQTFALQQQTEMIHARENGTEAEVAAAQAYTNAIRQGASETQAAALAAATLENYLARAESAAGGLATRMIDMQHSASTLTSGSATFSPGGGGQVIVGANAPMVVNPNTLGGGGGTGGNFNYMAGIVPTNLVDTAQLDKEYGSGNYQIVPYYQGGFGGRTATYGRIFIDQAKVDAYHQQQQQQAAQLAQQQASQAQSAAQQAQQAANTAFTNTIATNLVQGTAASSLIAQVQSGTMGGEDPATKFTELLDLYKRAGITPQQTLSDIKSGVLGQGADPTEVLKAIDDLTNSINTLNSSVVGLNDIYSQGHGAIGYYQAATGMSGIVQGQGGIDKVPVHMMLSRGELLSVIPQDIVQKMKDASSQGNNEATFQYIAQLLSTIPKSVSTPVIHAASGYEGVVGGDYPSFDRMLAAMPKPQVPVINMPDVPKPLVSPIINVPAEMPKQQAPVVNLPEMPKLPAPVVDLPELPRPQAPVVNLPDMPKPIVLPQRVDYPAPVVNVAPRDIRPVIQLPRLDQPDVFVHVQPPQVNMPEQARQAIDLHPILPRMDPPTLPQPDLNIYPTVVPPQPIILPQSERVIHAATGLQGGIEQGSSINFGNLLTGLVAKITAAKMPAEAQSKIEATQNSSQPFEVLSELTSKLPSAASERVYALFSQLFDAIKAAPKPIHAATGFSGIVGDSLGEAGVDMKNAASMFGDSVSQLAQNTPRDDAFQQALREFITKGRERVTSDKKIGSEQSYYHAASGLTGVVAGPAGIDKTPVNMMLSRGEGLAVIPQDIMLNASNKMQNSASTFGDNVSDLASTLNEAPGRSDIFQQALQQFARVQASRAQIITPQKEYHAASGMFGVAGPSSIQPSQDNIMSGIGSGIRDMASMFGSSVSDIAQSVGTGAQDDLKDILSQLLDAIKNNSQGGPTINQNFFAVGGNGTVGQRRSERQLAIATRRVTGGAA